MGTLKKATRRWWFRMTTIDKVILAIGWPLALAFIVVWALMCLVVGPIFFAYRWIDELDRD